MQTARRSFGSVYSEQFPRRAGAWCIQPTNMKPNPAQEGQQASSKMGMPHITTFCWCLGLEQGAKVIGYLHLITSLSMMVLCSVFAHSARDYIGTVEDAEDHLYSSWYTIAVVVAVVSVAHALLAASLLLSVYKRWWRGVRAWTWVMALLFVAALLYVVVAAVACGMSSSGSDIFLAFLEGLIFFGALAYCILCVHSYQLLLRSDDDMRGPAKAHC